MNRKLIEKADALLRKERGTVHKDPGGRITICLVYPNTYHVGMSNLGFQGIYGLLNRRNDVVCERAFLPDQADIEVYRRSKTPLFSLESKRPLDRFDIIAFSVSFENDYPNLITMLDLANIPFRSSERNRYHPLLMAGGTCLSFNPEPLAPFFDTVFIGEADESLQEFLDLYKNSGSRAALKKGALRIEGVYVPEYYSVTCGSEGTIAVREALNGAPARITRRYLKDLSCSLLNTAIITPESEFSNMYLIEAMRGCPWSCRFCLVGHLYNPPRRKAPDTIRAEIEEGKQRLVPPEPPFNKGEKGELKIGLIGPSLSDYPSLHDILCIEGVDFSITSLRASSRSAELVQLLKGHKSVSIAPEAGTARLRSVINKKITEKDIMDTSQLLFDAGIENLRLYFMIGLPTEEHADIEGIIELSRRVRDLTKKGTVTLSISTFVPKPFTPFQWHPMEPLVSVKEKLKRIKKALREIRGMRVLHDVPKYAYMQGLFSRGDRSIADVLVAMATTDDWKKACAASGINEDFYIFRKRSRDEVLPWDFIDTGTSKETLWAEYLEALSAAS